MDAEELARLYEESGSVSALARRLGIPYSTIHYRLGKAGIAIRSRGFASPRSKPVPRGSEHYNWKGGTYRHGDGYVYEYAPDHPAAPRAKGYVLQHRLVMERVLGRFLEDHEDVHHRNEIRDDNRPENLDLKSSRSEHIRHHKLGAKRDSRGRFRPVRADHPPGLL